MRRTPPDPSSVASRGSTPRRRAGLVVAAAALAVALTGAAPAAAATGPTTGADVSQWQCGRPWAGAQDFAVVAVNTGLPTGTNPCLAEQLALAAASPGTGSPRVSLYVNTADPDPRDASWWPTGDRTRRGAAVHPPHGRCRGGATTACAWVYGASLALDDLQVRGVPAGTRARWWLDVEAANSWSRSTARNRAVLEGMTSRFEAAHQRVGLYALDHEFRDLIGKVPAGSPLHRLPTWLAGAADRAGAALACTRAPLTGGRVLLTQWVAVAGTDRFDLDLACTAVPSPPVPRVTGAHRVGRTLQARAGHWPAGVRLHYRWTRDGKPIGGATTAHHRLVHRDAGHRIRVVVTGTRTGSSRAVRTSAAVRIPR